MRRRFPSTGPGASQNPDPETRTSNLSPNRTTEPIPMIDAKNRYGLTAARNNDADGLARRPSSTTVDIHAHIVVPQAARLAQPHVDLKRVPLAHFADEATREINAQQEKDIAEVMTSIDRRLHDLGRVVDVLHRRVDLPR